MADLYEILGVKRDATLADIKRAYRRKAKQAHPDAGGDAEKFGALQLAYSVLSDPDRRAHYDKTGEVKAREPDNAQAQVLDAFAQVFEAVVQDLVKIGQKPRHAKMIKLMQERIAQGRTMRATQRGQLEKQIAEWEDMRPRFSVKTGPNFFDSIISSKLVPAREQLAQLAKFDDLAERVADLLKDAKFKNDEPPKNMSASPGMAIFRFG